MASGPMADASFEAPLDRGMIDGFVKHWTEGVFGAGQSREPTAAEAN